MLPEQTSGTDKVFWGGGEQGSLDNFRASGNLVRLRPVRPPKQTPSRVRAVAGGFELIEIAGFHQGLKQ